MRWMPARLIFLVLVLQSLRPLSADPPYLPYAPLLSIGRGAWRHYLSLIHISAPTSPY